VIDVGATLPSAARLALSFDEVRLVEEVVALRNQQWKLQSTYSDYGDLTPAVIDWRTLPLRSVGGDTDRTDAGGPGIRGFADTLWLEKSPYLAEVLSNIPAQIRAARLMALGPGASNSVHIDNKYGPLWGTARLHVPVITTSGAKLFIEGELHQWQPGTLWFGDFSRAHRVENSDGVARVHLVIDTLVSEELLGLFPEEAIADLDISTVLVNKPLVPLPANELGKYRVCFLIPSTFTNWEEEDGEFLHTPDRDAAEVDMVDGALLNSNAPTLRWLRKTLTTPSSPARNAPPSGHAVLPVRLVRDCPASRSGLPRGHRLWTQALADRLQQPKKSRHRRRSRRASYDYCTGTTYVGTIGANGSVAGLC